MEKRQLLIIVEWFSAGQSIFEYGQTVNAIGEN